MSKICQGKDSCSIGPLFLFISDYNVFTNNPVER